MGRRLLNFDMGNHAAMAPPHTGDSTPSVHFWTSHPRDQGTAGPLKRGADPCSFVIDFSLFFLHSTFTKKSHFMFTTAITTRRMSGFITHTTAAIVLSAAAASAQAVLIAPIKVTSSIGSVHSGYIVDHLIDGSGMSSPASNASTVNNTYTSMWLGTGTTASLVFDLGATYSLTAADLWNYNYVPALARGVKNFNLKVSSDNLTFTQVLTGGKLAVGSGAAALRGESFAMAADARYVMLNLTSNYGDGAYIGLSEVRFEGALAAARLPTAVSLATPVPEPTSLALMLGGLAAVGGLLRQRRNG